MSIDPATRSAIEAVLVQYAIAIDSRDWDLLRSCFTDDCTADYGAIGSWSTPEELVEWMRETHEPCGHTLHRMTNVHVKMGDDGGMRARSYVHALVLFADNRSGTSASGFYDDELVESGGEWRIARRSFTSVLLQSVPDGAVFTLDG